MAKPRTLDREPGDEEMPTLQALTRRCTRCDKDRRVEFAGQPGTYSCEHCGAVSADFCHQCGGRSGSTITADDGRRLCPTCHLTALRAVASAPTDRCVECGVTVQEHISEFRKIVARLALQMTGQSVAEEWHSRPTILERRGMHSPRNKAVAARLRDEGRER